MATEDVLIAVAPLVDVEKNEEVFMVENDLIADRVGARPDRVDTSDAELLPVAVTERKLRVGVPALEKLRIAEAAELALFNGDAVTPLSKQRTLVTADKVTSV